MYEYIIYGSYEGISHLPTGAGFGNHPAVSRHLFFLMKKISSRGRNERFIRNTRLPHLC